MFKWPSAEWIRWVQRQCESISMIPTAGSQLDQMYLPQTYRLVGGKRTQNITILFGTRGIISRIKNNTNVRATAATREELQKRVYELSHKFCELRGAVSDAANE